jgi:hypothetical protein
MFHKLTFLMAIILMAMAFDTQAQWRLSGIEVEASIGGTLGEFTKDSLVFDRRKGNLALPGSAHFPVLLRLSKAGSRTSFYGGLGLHRHTSTMNKQNWADALFSIIIIPFGGQNFDTVYLSSVDMKATSLTFPLGVDWQMGGRQENPSSFHFRMLLIPGFRIGSSANATFDLRNRVPTPAEQASVNALYKATVNTFSLYLLPEINWQYRFVQNKFGTTLGLQPFSLDLISPNKRLYSGGVGLRFNFGLVYAW